MPSTSATKRLSLNEIRRRVAKFAVDYKDVKQEKQHTADFWKALIACYGIEDTFLHGVTFEYPAKRSDTGRDGFIDVFQPGLYLIEQKTEGRIRIPKGRAQSNAEEQASAYLTGGSITEAQMPRYVITSDFRSIQITDLMVPKSSPVRTTTFLTSDLVDHVEAFLFLTGDDSETLIAEEQAEASVKAARLMADLYEAITGDADAPEEPEDEEDEDQEVLEASILLTRLLFLMFGDDAGLWRRGQFQRFIEQRTAEDGSDLGPQLSALFEVLDTRPARRSKHVDEDMDAFPYVNGAIFRRGVSSTMFFDAAMREALLTACRFDWSTISPAVFGSLFQSVKSKDARREAGEHYTSEENILKTLNPMFLDGFRARLNAARTAADLTALHQDLANYRYVDPACGCGNFLIVAYREMRALELDLLARLRAKEGKSGDLELDPSDMLHVRLDQFYGIELNWWPAKIAETAMFLVDHQANQRMNKVLGLVPDRLPIDIEANITHSNALTVPWEDVLPTDDVTVFVFGNPPFLGHKSRTPEQKRELADAWGSGRTGQLDYVTAWHAQAMKYLAHRKGEFGFVTTNSIASGESVPDLFPRISDQGWVIKYAHRTFAWNSESAAKEKAAVHCVIVGFTRDEQPKQRLFNYATPKADPVEVKVSTGINGYLVDGPNIYVRPRSTALSSDLPAVSNGSMPNDGRHLLVSPDEHADVVADPIAAKYVRRFMGADELINGRDRWCLWLPEVDPRDITLSRVLKDRVQAVRDKRAASTRETTRELAATPHLFGEIRQPASDYLCIPRHFSESRLYATVAKCGPDVIAGDSTCTMPYGDGFGFAVISSAMFITWQKTVGGRIKSDPRFAATGTWNTLPMPPVNTSERAAIAAAGQAVLDARALHPNRSLADHYQPLAMTRELVKAHQDLDILVDKAFGAGRKRALDEVARQRVLFERYAELTTDS